MGRATYPEVVAGRQARFGRAALSDASLFGLALRGVCLAASCYHTRRCALTLSPEGPHRFTHHPLLQHFAVLQSAGWSLFCCTCRRPANESLQVLQNQQFTPDAPPLAGSLPCSVRTFLSPADVARQRPPDLLHCKAKTIIAIIVQHVQHKSISLLNLRQLSDL